MNSDPMATEKFEEGIRKFEEDTNKLGEIVRAKLGSSTTKA
jgi:transaldolase